MYKIEKMTKPYAENIMTWKYDGEYSIYSMTASQELLADLLDGSYYFAVKNEKLVGYYCFGRSAQVPVGNGSDAYENAGYIDIGLGINPALCGRGLGLDFILQGIAFANREFESTNFRLTVADFNTRAIKVYLRAGFIKERSFVHSTDGRVFDVMVVES